MLTVGSGEKVAQALCLAVQQPDKGCDPTKCDEHFDGTGQRPNEGVAKTDRPAIVAHHPGADRELAKRAAMSQQLDSHRHDDDAEHQGDNRDGPQHGIVDERASERGQHGEDDREIEQVVSHHVDCRPRGTKHETGGSQVECNRLAGDELVIPTVFLRVRWIFGAGCVRGQFDHASI